MNDTDIDLDAYRRRIGFDGPVTPTLATLTELIARHASALPFENIEVLAGRVPALDTAALQRKLVRHRRGGYCFEQNNFFLACLQQAGFAVRRLEARIRAGVPADVVTGRTHLVLRIALDGEDWMADVGCGGLAPLAPLRLASRSAQSAGSGVYRFVEGHGDLLLQASLEGQWSDCYRIGPVEPHPIDCEIGNWFVATHPKSMLRQNLLVARAWEGGRMTLFNRKLSLHRRETQAPQERTLNTRSEFADVLADGFGLEIDAADLDAVMAALERQPAG
jgi:N-hydroxyarylamine O-acetyltransferase